MKLIELESYIKRGSNRKKVFMAIRSSMVPAEIVKKIYGKISNTRFNIVSRALSELVKVRLLKIKNPEQKTGRLYELTEKGKKLKRTLNKQHINEIKTQ